MRKPSSKIETPQSLCYHGCGNLALFKTAGDKEICCESSNSCPVVKKKNSDSLREAYESGKRKSAKLVYKDLPEDTKARMNWNKNNFKADFSLNGKGSHKQVLIFERGHKCENCGLSEWFDKPITLELEHIDGVNTNNTKANLLLLCPNCHSQTQTWRGRNINKGKIKVSDDQLKDALSKSTSIRQALIEVGLTPKGGNYVRCNEMINGGVVKLANTSDLSSDA